MLRQGLFFYAGGYTYRHWRQSLPKHVRRTKAAFRPAAGMRDVPTGPLYRLLALGTAIFRFRAFWVRNRSKHAFPIAIASSTGGCVFIDPEAGKVARPIPDEYTSPPQIALRRSWAAHIPCVATSLEQESNLLIEDYISGNSFLALDEETQAAVYRRILSRYTALACAEKVPSHHSPLDVFLSEPVLSLLGSTIRHRLESARSLPFSGYWPLTPTFSDSHQGNIIIANGSDPVFIDCHILTLKPFFYTPIYIIARSQKLESLRSAYFSGHFDDEIAELFSAAGATYIATTDSREALVALTLALRALNASTFRGTPDESAALARRINWFSERSGLVATGAWGPAKSTTASHTDLVEEAGRLRARG